MQLRLINIWCFIIVGQKCEPYIKMNHCLRKGHDLALLLTNVNSDIRINNVWYKPGPKQNQFTPVCPLYSCHWWGWTHEVSLEYLQLNVLNEDTTIAPYVSWLATRWHPTKTKTWTTVRVNNITPHYDIMKTRVMICYSYHFYSFVLLDMTGNKCVKAHQIK